MKILFFRMYIFSLLSLITFVLNCSFYNSNEYKQNIDTIAKSANDWKDDLQSVKKYVNAVKVYHDNDSPDIDNMYDILGVSKDSSFDQIKQVFRKESLKTHPDKLVGKSESEKKEAEKRFKEINNAYTILTNEELKQAYELITSQENRLDFSSAEIDDISAALDRSVKMVETVKSNVGLLENNKFKQNDLDQLNKILKEQYQELKNISNGQITLDGILIENHIKDWSKSMLKNMEYLVNQTLDQIPNSHKEASRIIATERIDKGYLEWLYENNSNVIAPVHSNKRTPLQEAIYSGSLKMTQNVLNAADVHGISISTLLQPFKEEYATLISQNKKDEAKELINKVCAFNINKLCNEMKSITQKIDRLSQIKKDSIN